MNKHWLQFTTLALVLAARVALSAEVPVHLGPNGRLVYEPTELGDRVPDFSTCGYAGADRDVPSIPIRVVVQSKGKGATARIQDAIDHVSELPLDASGSRGAVLLAAGEFRVDGRLRIEASGVVLRGAGADRTKLIATGKSREPLIRIAPSKPARLRLGEAVPIANQYVPVGSTRVELPGNHGFAVGDAVLVLRPSTEAWIEALNAKVDGIGWRAGRCDIRWERTITKVNGAQVTFDAPLTTALDAQYGGGTVALVRSNHRLHEIGVEDLTLSSAVEGENPKDEDHSWHGVVANGTQDLWVRRIRFEGFAGGAVLLREGVRRATIEDCLSTAPISELGGYRRHSFFTQGQQTLFVRCWAEQGLHDFAVGHAAAGPNAFVNCYAHETHGDSGPLESWASGVLYDNVRIDGGDLFLGNRWSEPPGVGWSAANCVAWQCQAAQLHCFSPPTAQNWAIGYWAKPAGDGELYGLSDFVRPVSLFKTQLGERLGESAAERAGNFLLDPVAATSPSLAEAEAFVAKSNEPPLTLRDLIEERLAATPEPDASDAVNAAPSSLGSTGQADSTKRKLFSIENGWVVRDGKVVTGSWVNPTWWRGVIRPDEAPGYGPSITRYAPGRYGLGLTDELDEVIGQMQRNGQGVYDHHYGLWYDRRRDDHLMVRRANGAVAPPFYEQPFARTGHGKAWDGLSKYDLTRFNPWYWKRLADFAELAERDGIMLAHQSYFQHNILEAGAHWADCPWRPANNVNETNLTEPPPYIGDKRLFIAHQFYDPKNKALRALHTGYLRHAVANFAERSNVIHFTSGEYTGPLEFTRFWLDTVASEQKASRAKGLIGLSATKNVQDAILADTERSDAVDLIDIRYWCYDREGGLFAPEGGVNLAMRQHRRQSSSAAGDARSVARAVSEYRLRYPTKAVCFNAGRFCRTPNDGWATLAAGGSLAAVPSLPVELKRALVKMQPSKSANEGLLSLADAKGSRLVYALKDAAQIEAPNAPAAASYRVRWIDPATGGVTGETVLQAGGKTSMIQRVAWVTRR